MKKLLIILTILFFALPCLGATVYVKKIAGTVYYDATAISCNDVTIADTSGDLEDAEDAAGAGGTLYICGCEYLAADVDADSTINTTVAAINIEKGTKIRGMVSTAATIAIAPFGSGADPLFFGMDASTGYSVVAGTVYSKASVSPGPNWATYNGTLLTYVMMKLTFDSGSTEPTIGERIDEEGGDAGGVIVSYVHSGGVWGDGTATGYINVADVFGTFDNNTLINGTVTGDNFATANGGWATATSDIILNQFARSGTTVYVNVGEDPDIGTLEICQRDKFMYIGTNNNVDIDGLTFEFSNNKGISQGNGDDTTIQNCSFSYIRGASGCAIQTDSDNTGHMVDNCVFKDCKYGITCINAVEAAINITISDCEFYNTDWFMGRHYWSGSICFNKSTGGTAYGNYIHDTCGDGISFKNADSNTIYSNLIVNVKDGLSIESSDSNLFYNNTIYGATSSLAGGFSWPRIKLGDNFGAGAAANSNVLKNNNVYAVSGDGNRHCVVADSAGVNNELDYNHYYNTDDAATISWDEGGGAWTGTLVQFQAAFANKYEQNALAEADPKFVDAANDDYHLLVSSPCIDAGANLTATVLTDIDGQDADHANMDGDADGSSTDMDIGADQVPFKVVMTAAGTSSYVLIDGQDDNYAGLAISGGQTIDNVTISRCPSGAFRVNGNQTVNNMAIDDECYVASGVTLTANNCAFQEAKATAQGDGTITDTDCQFSISDFGFVDKSNGDFTLQSTSVCINQGTDTGSGDQTDVDGNDLYGAVDVGSQEYQQPENALWFNNSTGNDSNTSISSGVPLLTFDHLSRLGLADGCTIYLRGGQTWADTFDTPSPGFLGGVITLKSYGSGGPAILTGIPNFDEEFWQVEGIEFR